MSELILHHYDTSPFSEKVKAILAHKQVPWRAVEQPTIMPKPNLVPLTGGYRRIPVLQIGADIYCDSQLIARTLERFHPKPTIYPGGSEGACHMISLWSDRMFFFSTVAIVFSLLGASVPQEFIDDRTKLMGGRADFAELPKQAPYAKEQCRAFAHMLAAQLADGRPYVLGSAFSLADASCYHPVWFLRSFPGATAVFDEFPAIAAWADRIRAMGHGQRRDMEPAEALRIATSSRPATPPATDPGEPNRLKPGDEVTIVPDDYGFEPVRGAIVSSSVHEIAIRRSEEPVGEIVVHFPRAGFRVTPAASH